MTRCCSSSRAEQQQQQQVQLIMQSAMGSSSSSSSSGRASRRARPLLVVVAAAAAAAVALSSAGGVAAQSCPQWGPAASGQGVTAAERAATAPHVFSELTADEYAAVFDFLLNAKSLNLVDLSVTALTTNSLRVNYVHGIWYQMPPKAAVLAHVDKDGPAPPRKARALLVLGAAEPPVVKEVLVTITYTSDGKPKAGNLERANVHSSKWSEVPYYQRPHGVMDQVGQVIALTKVNDKLNAFLRVAFDGYTYGDSCDPKCIGDNYGGYQYLSPQLPRAIYVWFFLPEQLYGDGGYTHPLPLQILVAGKGPALTDWEITRWWFNGQSFPTIDALIQAWNSDKGGIRSSFKLIKPIGAGALYSNFLPRPGPKRGAAQPVGAISYEPYGRRYSIDKGNHISWLGWELYVGYLPHYGPRYMDVRFKGERIAYEIAMQEASASYGADDLSQANTVYLDSHWGLGASVRELVQGIDCPLTAAYLDAATFYKGSSAVNVHRNAICVFEHNPNTPALRHYSYSYRFYGAVPGANLVIRMVSEINNYDYVADLILSIDGHLEVKVVTSGFVQAAAFRQSYPNTFGYPLTYNISGTLHTHVLAWKADLDIGGNSANSVNVHHMGVGQVDDGNGNKININKYEAKLAETENEASFAADFSKPKIPVVVNENAKNAYGAPRGYAVQLNRPLLNLEPSSAPKSKAFGFQKYSFAATKQRDQEAQSSSIYGQADLGNPSTTLTDYVNGEKLRNEDVVVWVSSGLYHIPHAEDAPVTPTTGNMLGFSIFPFNWATENPATDMADMVQIEEDDGRVVPAAKAAAAKTKKCAPSYEDVKFLDSGWESA